MSKYLAARRKPSGSDCSLIEGLTSVSRRQPHTMRDDPIAYFITWTCYGTHLPGDERGWTKWHKGDQLPQPLLADWCRDRMTESAVVLDTKQRAIVNKVVLDHCRIRGWTLHAINCRSNHCHVVVTAVDYDGEQVRDQLKSWGTRRLKAHQRTLEAEGRKPSGEVREHWWTGKGSVRKLFDDESLAAAIQYTNEAQDRGGSKANRE
jgi:REP element-mobilizing transposase RayT